MGEALSAHHRRSGRETLGATRSPQDHLGRPPRRVDGTAGAGHAPMAQVAASRAVPALIRQWEARLHVGVSAYFLQRMKTKWGSCNPRARHIRLNTELVRKRKDLLEYVVVHEMLHVREPAHGERFVELLDAHCPTSREARAELNALPLATEAWGASVQPGIGPSAPLLLAAESRRAIGSSGALGGEPLPEPRRQRVQRRWSSGASPTTIDWGGCPGLSAVHPRLLPFIRAVCRSSQSPSLPAGGPISWLPVHRHKEPP